jgi:hypothetical protein
MNFIMLVIANVNYFLMVMDFFLLVDLDDMFKILEALTL